MTKRKSSPQARAAQAAVRSSVRRRTRWMMVVVVGSLALILVMAYIALSNRTIQPSDPQQAMTLQPEIRANLTALPRATPLTGEAANELNTLASLVTACADYHEARQAQMLQHIAWLIDPSGIPADLIPAFGANPQERLLFGMMTYTQIDWRSVNQSRESCLFTIGQRVNTMLVAAGGDSFPDFAA